jgi:hypothetical protein
MKNAVCTWVRVLDSSAFKLGPDDTHLRTANNMPVGTLTTTEVFVQPTPEWASDGQILIRQESPLPLTVVSTVLDVTPGG